MGYGVRLHIWGDRACFTRPEMKGERVSYDVITPSAARGILEAIHWKPAIRWQVDRIHVLKPICFETFRRNEVGSKIPVNNISAAQKKGSTEGLANYVEEDRQQRAMTLLRDVSYIIEAHFEMTDRAGPGDNEGKHLDIFRRRAESGQCFHMPCLGVREFPASFRLLGDEEPLPASLIPDHDRNRDLGWMLHDIDFQHHSTPRFFRAELRDGVVHVPAWNSEEIKS